MHQKEAQESQSRRQQLAMSEHKAMLAVFRINADRVNKPYRSQLQLHYPTQDSRSSKILYYYRTLLAQLRVQGLTSWGINKQLPYWPVFCNKYLFNFLASYSIANAYGRKANFSHELHARLRESATRCVPRCGQDPDRSWRSSACCRGKYSASRSAISASYLNLQNKVAFVDDTANSPGANLDYFDKVIKEFSASISNFGSNCRLDYIKQTT